MPATSSRLESELPGARPVPASSPLPRFKPARRSSTEAPPLVPPVERVRPPGPSLAPAAPDVLSVPLPQSALAPLAAAVAAPGATAVPPKPANPPPVVIDRIEIVTPPARPPAADPLASVAARRAGFSRHRGSR